MLLEIKDLQVHFRTKKGIVRAVDDASFSIDQGEVLALVGESGSGKSVTSLSVMGLLQPPGRVSGGEILFKGENLLQKKRKEMQALRGIDISMIFQEPMTSLNPVYKVKNQLMESIMLHMKLPKKEAYQRAIEMLKLVGIPSAKERAESFPHQMSGGMRQRVMIAMALSCNPQLLIADEPTTALDVTIQAQILDLLNQMRERFHMAILLITHDLGVVSEMADKVAVMYCGKIMEAADMRSLFDNPLHPYTHGLLKSIPRLDDDRDGPLYMIRGMVPNPLNMPEGCPFSDRCDRCMERCRHEMPEMTDLNGHSVRCFLYSQEKEGVEENE